MIGEIVLYTFSGIIAILILLLLFYRFWFLRDPERAVPEGDNIVSPADGKVIKVMRIDSEDEEQGLKIRKGMFGSIDTLSKDVEGARWLISIFMSPLDVHVQRAPMDGRVAGVRYKEGTFVAANSLDALKNEKNEIILEELETKVKVIQIAGFLARRIQCFVKKGDHVLKGEKIGRIIIGSQVSMILPEGYSIRVKQGDRVKAGESIIAEYGLD